MAASLTALLAAGVVGVFVPLTRDGSAGRRAELTADRAVDRALGLLAWDLAQARYTAPLDGRDAGDGRPVVATLTLAGLNGRVAAAADGDERSAAGAGPAGRPAAVTWRVRPVAGVDALVREERDRGPGGRPPRREVVLRGVEAFTLQPLGTALPTDGPPRSGGDDAFGGGPDGRAGGAAPGGDAVDRDAFRPAAEGRRRARPAGPGGLTSGGAGRNGSATLRPWGAGADPGLKTQLDDDAGPVPPAFRVRLHAAGGRPRDVVLDTGALP